MPPTNPAAWRDLLLRRLDLRWQEMVVYEAYFEGDQALSFITKKYRDAYGAFFKGLTDNWMPLVVEASVERLRVQGFRFGNDPDADDEAWAIWQANGMDAQADQVHMESVKLGESYWMVQPNGDQPKITAEHPSQVIVATAPGDRRQRLAGLKKWAEDDSIFCNVYLADRVVKYQTTRRQLSVEPLGSPKRWTTIGSEFNPLGAVPIIPVPNNPTMLRGGRSDLKGGPMSIQDAVNLLLSGLLVGGEYMAYPLRVMLGVDVPKDPVTGDPIPNAELKVSQSRLLTFPGDAREMDVKEFAGADLKNFRDAIDGLIRDLTAQTRTPPHYVSGEIVNASGDALKAAETGLVSKVRRKMDPFGEAHEDTMRLAFRAMDPDDPRAEAFDAETIWRDPESRSDAERVDAATKLKTIGVPQEVLWERVGYSPQEIDRMRGMAEADRLLAAATAPPTNGQVPPEEAEQAVSNASQPAVT